MAIQTTPSLAAKITKPTRGKARKAVSEKSQQHSENWPQAQKSITVGPDRSSIALLACRTSGRMKRISSSPRATVETVSPSARSRRSWLAIGLREQKTRGAICLLLIAKKMLGGTWDYLRENKDYPYYLLQSRLRAPEGASVRAVKRGEGKIVRLGPKKLAVYRDNSGKVKKMSGVCTHMGCIVRWNDAEATWDCPCHGSRFGPTGQVLAGPAETALRSA